MLLVSLLILLLLPAPVEDAAQAGELEALQRGYAAQPGPQWETRAEALIARAPTSTTAGRTLVWLGALALYSHRAALAEARFTALRRGWPHGELGVLASRGLGDAALSTGRWRDAMARYDEGLAEASPLLVHELEEKREIARRELVRSRLELGAWLLVAACLLWLAWPTRRPGLSVPFEVRMVVPVYALLIFVAWGRDPHVPYAMLWIGIGSIVLLAAGRRPARHPRPLLDGLVLCAGSVAVIFIGLRRAGILDALAETFKTAGPK